MGALRENGTWIAFLVTTAAVCVAAVIDFRRFRVPNALTFPLCIGGLAFHTIRDGIPGLHFSAGGMLIGCLVLLLFYVMGVMGAGDVKLMGAVGAWIGVSYVTYAFCVAGLAAGFCSLVALAWQRRLHEIPAMMQVTWIQLMTLGHHIAGAESASLAATVQQKDRRRVVLPFAVMIAIGVVVVGITGLGLDWMGTRP